MANNNELWHTWLVLGGRGSGKTRTGAEWVRAQAIGEPPLADRRSHRIALIGDTIAQVRSVMIEGVSGLLSVYPPDDRPKLEVSRNQLVWPNGTIAQMFAADDPDSLRGPQFDAAWCDELCKWRAPDYAWDTLQFALRLGTLAAVRGHHHAARHPAVEEDAGRPRHRHHPLAHRRQRQLSVAVVPGRDGAPLRRNADRPRRSSKARSSRSA